jgi:hypothetical protein
LIRKLIATALLCAVTACSGAGVTQSTTAAPVAPAIHAQKNLIVYPLSSIYWGGGSAKGNVTMTESWRCTHSMLVPYDPSSFTVSPTTGLTAHETYTPNSCFASGGDYVDFHFTTSGYGSYYDCTFRESASNFFVYHEGKDASCVVKGRDGDYYGEEVWAFYDPNT